jgi:hypothetical protein
MKTIIVNIPDKDEAFMKKLFKKLNVKFSVLSNNSRKIGKSLN